MTPAAFPRLHPLQVCFVVEDVDAAVEECVERFGWGPFHRFSAPVPVARYHDWTGAKKTDVALGMAGGVQVELIHVHEGHDTVEAYQARYGAGPQHLGISCRDREQALAGLETIGAGLDDQGEHPGVRFAFVDTPTGPGLFELLQTTGDTPPPGGGADAQAKAVTSPPAVALDRATIVTDDLDRALAFHARAFRWEDVPIETRTLRVESSARARAPELPKGSEHRVRRARARAGQLLLELIEPAPGADHPYARHLARGDHGLIHAGGVPATSELPDGATFAGEWLEDGEAFALYDWSGGAHSLQLRREAA